LEQDLNQPLTVISGAIGLLENALSKSQILHRAASNMNIDGFNVTRIRVFEDPLTGHIELENTSVCESVLTKFVTSSNKAFKGIKHRFLVTLVLSDFTQPQNGVEMTYSIKRLSKDNRKFTDETVISIAQKMQTELLVSVEDAVGVPFVTVPAA